MDKIVLLDAYPISIGDISYEGLEALGQVQIYDKLADTKEEIINRIKDANIIITNKTPIDKDTIDQAPKLKYIGVAATGYNPIDVAYARSKGIITTNVPAYSIKAVGQMTFGLILELTTRVGHHASEIRSGRWQEENYWTFWDYPLIELSGKTLGILGYGRIGKEVAKIAKAFSMQVLAYSPRSQIVEEEGIKAASIEDIYEKAHIISLHLPLLESTRNMINEETISQMNQDPILINTARGDLVDEEAIARALKDGRLAGYGADVSKVEPIRDDNPLVKEKNAILTPHMAWAAKETRQRLMDTVVDNIKAYQAGRPVNVVEG